MLFVFIFLKLVIPLKYYLADDNVPNGQLLVGENYSKHKKMKNDLTEYLL